MQHPGDGPPSGPLDSEYEVLKVLAAGAFGRVCLVSRRSDGKVLASKEIDYFAMSHKQRAQVVLEVNILRDLAHPNIVGYFGRYLDRQNHKLHILMEHCDAGDLSQAIRAHKAQATRFKESRIWHVLAQLVLALHQCHSGGAKSVVLHRDIKPENVFLESSGTVKLGDFGLSTRVSESVSFAETYVGTPYYMSPEIVRGRSYCAKSDIWALGCLVYQMCTLEPPFKGSNIMTLHSNISSGRYRKISSYYSSQLHEIVGSMLHVDPNTRISASGLLQHPAIHKEIEYIERLRALEKREAAVLQKQEALAAVEARIKSETLTLVEIKRSLEAREAQVQRECEKLEAKKQGLADSKLGDIQDALRNLHVESSSSRSSRSFTTSNPFLPLEKAIHEFYYERSRPSLGRRKPRHKDQVLSDSDSSTNIFLPVNMKNLPRNTSRSLRTRAA